MELRFANLAYGRRDAFPILIDKPSALAITAARLGEGVAGDDGRWGASDFSATALGGDVGRR